MTRLRSLAGFAVARTGIFRPAQWICGRLGGGFILAYHELPASFEDQIDALRPNEPVHLGELYARLREGRTTAGLFAITVDDGVGDTTRGISAICRRRQWPVTFYLPTSYLDERRGLSCQVWRAVLPHLRPARIGLSSSTHDLTAPEALKNFEHQLDRVMYTRPREDYASTFEELRRWVLAERLATAEQVATPEPISWGEVADLARHPAIRFESHGVTHTAVAALAPDDLRAELEASQRRIAEHTNRECRHFCYPYGGRESIGETAPALAGKIYDTAVTMGRGRLGGRDRMLLPRIPIYDQDTCESSKLKTLTL